MAIVTQAASGFGVALVSMPLLVTMLGVTVAAPLVNLIGVTTEVVLLTRYRHTFTWREVIRLVIPSLAAIPLGVSMVKWVNAEVVTAVLGLVLIAYAIYALLDRWLPPLNDPRWAYGFGFMGGLLSGAYNTSGPPIIIYATCRRWPPQTFKGNLQGYFLLNSVMTLITHALAGHFERVIWQNFLWALPGIVLGLLVGFRLEGWLDPQRFRRVVLVVLIGLGIRLLVWR